MVAASKRRLIVFIKRDIISSKHCVKMYRVCQKMLTEDPVPLITSWVAKLRHEQIPPNVNKNTYSVALFFGPRCIK